MDAEIIQKLIETGLPGAKAQVQGDDGVHFEATVVSEAFADRAYNSDGSLVSRRLDGAVLHDAAMVAWAVI